MSLAVVTPRYLGIQGRGTIALPSDVRRRYHLDEPGAQVKLIERADGILELHPALPVPSDQRWFWTQRWQQRELAVDQALAEGKSTVFEDGAGFLSHLETLMHDEA